MLVCLKHAAAAQRSAARTHRRRAAPPCPPPRLVSSIPANNLYLPDLRHILGLEERLRLPRGRARPLLLRGHHREHFVCDLGAVLVVGCQAMVPVS